MKIYFSKNKYIILSFVSLFIILTLYIIIYITSNTKKDTSNNNSQFFQHLTDYNKYLEKNNYKEALNLAKKINEYSLSINNDTLIAKSYDLIGDVYDIIEQNDTALYYHKLAFDYWIKTNNYKYYSRAYNQVGLNYFRKGLLNEAIDYFNNSLLYTNYNPLIKRYKILNNLGCAYFQRGNYNEAIYVFSESYKSATNEKLNAAILLNMINLSLSYYNIADYTTGNKYLNLALQQSSNSEFKFPYAYALQTKGFYFSKINQLDSAVKYYDLSLSYYNKIKQLLNANEVKLALAKMYINNKEFTKAKKLLDETLNYFTNDYKSEKLLGNNYYLLALLYSEINNFQLSSAFIQKALELSNSINAFDLIRDLYFLQYKIYLKQNDNNNALKSLEMYNLYNDKIINQAKLDRIYDIERNIILKEKTQKIVEMETENKIYKQNIILISVISLIIFILLILSIYFYIKLRKSRNEISNQKNELINKNNKLLEEQEKNFELNQIKNKILSVIGHDLRSQLSIIINYSELISLKTCDHYAKERISFIYQSATNNLELLESLVSWAKIHSEDIVIASEECDAKQLIDDILNFYNISYTSKNININKNYSNLIFLSDKNMVSTILRNIISNAIKFSPENNEIEISLLENKNNFVIKIINQIQNKTNFPPSVFLDTNTIEKNVGSKGEVGLGIGLEIIKYFLNKIDRNLYLMYKENIGFIAELTFNKK